MYVIEHQIGSMPLAIYLLAIFAIIVIISQVLIWLFKGSARISIATLIIELCLAVIVPFALEIKHSNDIVTETEAVHGETITEKLDEQQEQDSLKQESEIKIENNKINADGYVTDYETVYTVTDVQTGELFECNCKITGNLKDGKLEGTGKLKNLDTGFEYAGEFLNGKYHGLGSFKLSSGETFTMYFENGMPQDDMLNTLLFLGVESENNSGFYIGERTVEFLQNNSKAVNNIEKPSDNSYYTKNSFDIREINKSGKSLEGNTYKLPELLITQINTITPIRDNEVTEIVAVDKEMNIYELLCAGNMPNIYEKDVIQADALYVSPVGWENVGGGYTNSNLFVVLTYSKVSN